MFPITNIKLVIYKRATKADQNVLYRKFLYTDEITEIFYLTGEFSKEFDRHQLNDDNGKKHRNKPNRLSESEVMTILVAFHLSGMRCLKHYFLFYVCKHLHSSFPNLVSYSRFVELQQQVLLPLVLFLKICRMGKTTSAGINFIDSTSLLVIILGEHELLNEVNLVYHLS